MQHVPEQQTLLPLVLITIKADEFAWAVPIKDAKSSLIALPIPATV
jgi:hypothetical protein